MRFHPARGGTSPPRLEADLCAAAPGPAGPREEAAQRARRERTRAFVNGCAALLALPLLASCGGGGGADPAATPIAAAPAPGGAPAPAPAPPAPAPPAPAPPAPAPPAPAPPAPSPPAPAPPAPAPPAPAPPAPATPGDLPPNYRLVWADEFTTDGLPDPTKWDYDIERNRAGWYNNERQYYAAARTENTLVSNGTLHITARLETLSSAPDWGGQIYTSARLITRGKAAWTYGYFEVRAKLPCGLGTWPALWTLGSGGNWPGDGEIDILEQVGSNPSRVFGTVHTLVSGGAGTGAATQINDACTAFHDYQMHWTASGIAIGVDGVAYYHYANPLAGTSSWPFDAPQYLLLNIAIGGTLGGSIDNTIFPVTMEIAHVRVWQAGP